MIVSGASLPYLGRDLPESKMMSVDIGDRYSVRAGAPHVFFTAGIP
jgi:hypothetical protein